MRQLIQEGCSAIGTDRRNAKVVALSSLLPRAPPVLFLNPLDHAEPGPVFLPVNGGGLHETRSPSLRHRRVKYGNFWERHRCGKMRAKHGHISVGTAGNIRVAEDPLRNATRTWPIRARPAIQGPTPAHAPSCATIRGFQAALVTSFLLPEGINIEPCFMRSVLGSCRGKSVIWMTVPCWRDGDSRGTHLRSANWSKPACETSVPVKLRATALLPKADHPARVLETTFGLFAAPALELVGLPLRERDILTTSCANPDLDAVTIAENSPSSATRGGGAVHALLPLSKARLVHLTLLLYTLDAEGLVHLLPSEKRLATAVLLPPAKLLRLPLRELSVL